MNCIFKIYSKQIITVGFCNYIQIDICWIIWFEISINIQSDFRGKGLGKAFLLESIRQYLVAHPECNSISAEVIPNNLASCKMFEACGFIMQTSADVLKYEMTLNR